MAPRRSILKPVLVIKHWRKGGVAQRSKIDLLAALLPGNVNVIKGPAEQTSPLTQSEGASSATWSSVEEDISDQLTRYYKNKKIVVTEWHEQRDAIFDAFLSASWPLVRAGDKCSSCQKLSDLFFLCEDCGPQYVECMSCSNASHDMRPLHFRRLWNGHKYIQADGVVVIETQHNSTCTSRILRLMDIYDCKGRHHKVKMRFCNCEKRAATLLKHGLWPARPVSPNAAYHIDFLMLLSALTLECHVSVKGFTGTLKHLHSLSDSQTDSLYRLFHNESFEEFRVLQARLASLMQQSERLCPICPKKRELIVCMDGNFGLVRKENSGRSFDPPILAGSLFIDDEDVQQHIKRANDTNNTQYKADCSEFEAGSSVRSQKTATKLDVTGVFGAICRHEIPLKFMNMKHGERLGYPSLLLKAVMATCPPDTKLLVSYDIACTLEKYLKKHFPEEQRKRISMAVPIFHCYGHQASCQVKYSPRRVSGFGLIDGEGIERLWSYMRPFCKITKEMTPAHRINLLTVALKHYAVKKEKDLAEWLVDRVEDGHKHLMVCKAELGAISERYHVTLDDASLKRMALAEREQFSSKQKPTIGKPWQNSYVQMLFKWSALRKVCPDVDSEEAVDLDNQIRAIEHRHTIRQRWNSGSTQFKEARSKLEKDVSENNVAKLLPHARDRHFLLSLMRKYSNDGQQIAKRLRAQLEKSTKKIKNIVDAHNAQPFISNKIDVHEAHSIKSSLYTAHEEIDGPNSEDAPSMTQEAVRLYHRRRRCEEERESCLSEMCILLNHVLDQHEWLAKSRQQNAPTPPAKGLNLLINEKIEQLEEYYLVIKGMFRPFINGIPEMKRLPKTSYKNLSEMQQNSDDTEECEVPQPEYPCPLIEEPNSEDEF